MPKKKSRDWWREWYGEGSERKFTKRPREWWEHYEEFKMPEIRTWHPKRQAREHMLEGAFGPRASHWSYSEGPGHTITPNPRRRRRRLPPRNKRTGRFMKRRS